MPNVKPGQIVRFTYTPKEKNESASFEDRFKEVFVLAANYMGKMHGIDLKKLTSAEKEVLQAIMDPKTKAKPHRLPLVNDVVRRMDPINEIKNPVTFYNKFVKLFLRNKDAYRMYEHSRMTGTVVTRNIKITGAYVNPNPLFKKI